ncbi:methyltransferase domain-containing protein [Streptomyces sp. NPDC005485]|uniref:methyltransferase domain-containing protein n=1 Tax=Streptomyces sp. NPDC005485 TaxID=3155591 RepID=UPI00339ED114
MRHRGEHYTLDDIAFLPRPAQRPGVPVWAAGFPGNVKHIRHAARFKGRFPASLDHPHQLVEAVAALTDRATARWLRTTSPSLCRSAAPPSRTRTPAQRDGFRSLTQVHGDGDTVRGVLRDGPAAQEGDSMFDYDSELVHYHRRLWSALDVRPHDRVLDIGCGTGQTTRDAGRAASPGSALGIDISSPMLTRARQQTETEGLRNVSFVQGDAQTYAFPPEHFTLATSRFGTMFFSDRIAAFANIGRALHPGARFVHLVWQSGERQEWHTAIRAALSPERVSSTPAGESDGPFALADPDVVSGALTAAGFTKVDVVDVREPVYYGPDAERACAAVLQLWMAKEMITDMDAASAERARDRLYATLDAHDTGDGVWFDSRAWLVIAHRS